MSEISFTYPLVVLDFEATALTLTSYPIEVGVARFMRPGSTIDTWSTLIAPDPAWDMTSQWDRDAERLHGIRRWDLRDGAPASAAMVALNEFVAVTGQVVCDGGDYDRHWLKMLATAADVDPQFELLDISDGLRGNDRLAAAYRDALNGTKPEHRAGFEAQRICAALDRAAQVVGRPIEAVREVLDWREHDDGDCPVEPAIRVIIRFRNGQEAGPAPAPDWRWKMWSIGKTDWDIVAWRLP